MYINRQVIIAALIISMSLSTAAYAGILSIGVAVNVDAVSVSVSYPTIPYIPWREDELGRGLQEVN